MLSKCQFFADKKLRKHGMFWIFFRFLVDTVNTMVIILNGSEGEISSVHHTIFPEGQPLHACVFLWCTCICFLFILVAGLSIYSKSLAAVIFF